MSRPLWRRAGPAPPGASPGRKRLGRPLLLARRLRYARLSNATLMVAILLLYLGGSPGSCAVEGKTTSLATLLVILWNLFRGGPASRNRLECPGSGKAAGRTRG